MDYPYHEAALVFPPMSDEELNALAEDIERHGLREPIELYDGQVIDGRHRLMGCQMAGVEPEFINIETDDPIAYSVSKNKHRRHLNETQKAMVADSIRGHYEALARRRQAEAGGDTRNKALPVNLPEALGDSRDKAGKQFGIGGKSVDFARTVREQGSRELVDACNRGEVAVSAAAKVAELPKEKQAELINTTRDNGGSVRKAVSDAAKEVKHIRSSLEDWTDSEIERRKLVENGTTVVANKNTDARLIAWADHEGLSVLIGRGTTYGNPFVISEDGSREEVCCSYADHYYPHKPSIQDRVESGELNGKVLICWCHPEACHGHFLAGLANEVHK